MPETEIEELRRKVFALDKLADRIKISATMFVFFVALFFGVTLYQFPDLTVKAKRDAAEISILVERARDDEYRAGEVLGELRIKEAEATEHLAKIRRLAETLGRVEYRPTFLDASNKTPQKVTSRAWDICALRQFSIVDHETEHKGCELERDEDSGTWTLSAATHRSVTCSAICFNVRAR